MYLEKIPITDLMPDDSLMLIYDFIYKKDGKIISKKEYEYFKKMCLL